MFNNIKLDRPRISIDFNEIVSKDLYLLAVTDIETDSDGKEVKLFEGKKVFIYSDDCGANKQGVEEILIADGTAELNDGENWAPHVKWCIRIDDMGVRYEPLERT